MHKLAVKLDNIERRKRTTGLLHVVAGCFLLLKTFDYWRLQPNTNATQWRELFYLAAALLSIGYGVLKKSKDPTARYNRWVRLLQVYVFTALGFAFVSLGRNVDVVILFAWAVACLLLMFTERKVFHDAEMHFGKEGIFIPGYFTNRRLFWSHVSSVVVRPDFITIFQTDESFLQYEVLKNIPAATLNDIDAYCTEQIRQGTNAA